MLIANSQFIVCVKNGEHEIGEIENATIEERIKHSIFAKLSYPKGVRKI